MFIVDTEIEINWLFPATTAVYANTDFDVIVKKPDGASQYIDGSIEPGGAIKDADYIAATPSTVGGITYRLTPDQVGVWLVVLTQGQDDDSDIYNEYYLRVSEPDNQIYQQVKV